MKPKKPGAVDEPPMIILVLAILAIFIGIVGTFWSKREPATCAQIVATVKALPPYLPPDEATRERAAECRK